MRRKYLLPIVFVSCIWNFALSGCGGGGGNTVASTSTVTATSNADTTAASIYSGGVGIITAPVPVQVAAVPPSLVPVTREEVVALPDYDLSGYVSVVNAVTTDHPEVTQESETERRLIVDSIKTTFQARARPAYGDTDYKKLWLSLTPDEKWLAIKHPGKAVKTLATRSDALRITENAFPNDHTLHNTKADGFRHALWNILMCERIDPQWAEEEATAHEAEPDNPADEKAMDLHNNDIGRRIYGHYPSHTEIQLLVDLIRHMGEHQFSKISTPNDIGNTESLVYLVEEGQ